MDKEENILKPINEDNKELVDKEKDLLDEFINKLPDWDLMPPNTPIRRVDRISW